MKTSWTIFRMPALVTLVTLSCGVLSGCELDRPNFQMNSNSPTPFFGIDLIPRRKTTSLTRPPVSEWMADAGNVNPPVVDAQPAAKRSPKRNVSALHTPSQTTILPLIEKDSAVMINRGPVELFP